MRHHPPADLVVAHGADSTRRASISHTRFAASTAGGLSRAVAGRDQPGQLEADERRAGQRAQQRDAPRAAAARPPPAWRTAGAKAGSTTSRSNDRKQRRPAVRVSTRCEYSPGPARGARRRSAARCPASRTASSSSGLRAGGREPPPPATAPGRRGRSRPPRGGQPSEPPGGRRAPAGAADRAARLGAEALRLPPRPVPRRPQPGRPRAGRPPSTAPARTSKPSVGCQGRRQRRGLARSASAPSTTASAAVGSSARGSPANELNPPPPGPCAAAGRWRPRRLPPWSSASCTYSQRLLRSAARREARWAHPAGRRPATPRPPGPPPRRRARPPGGRRRHRAG